MTRRCLVAAALVAACAACGDVQATHEEPPVTSVSPPPGAYPRIPTVVLTADLPATIYYTVDGSEPTTESASAVGRVEITDAEEGTPVRFFAVGSRGDAEEVQEATYTLGPAVAPVANLTVEAVGSTGAEVSWDAPEGDTADGVLLVRLYGKVAQPAAGAEYVPGQAALAGEVVYRGTDTSFTDEDLVPGIAMYAAYAVDLADNYSSPVVGVAELPLPVQSIELSIDTNDGDATQDVSVGKSPRNLGMVVSSHGNSTSTSPQVAITFTNSTSRVLYNPKLLIRSAQVAGVDVPTASFETYGQGGGAVDGALKDGDVPFFWIEPMPNGWAPGTERQLLLIINGQAVDTTIDLELEVLATPMLIGLTSYATDPRKGAQLFDPSVGLASGPEDEAYLPISATGPGARYGYRRGTFSLDGRTLYLGVQNSPHIVVADLVTMGETAGFRVEGEHAKAHVRQVAMGRDGRTLYALFIDGAHTQHITAAPGSAETPIHVELVAIDSVTWKEVGRVRLATRSGPTDRALRGRHLAVSPDGTTVAITSSGGIGDLDDDDTSEDKGSVHLVDLASMTEIDTDPRASGVQPIALDAIPLKGGGVDETVVVSPSGICFASAHRLLVGTTNDSGVGPNAAITARNDVVVDIDLDDYSTLAVVTGQKINKCLPHGGGPLLVGGSNPDGLLRYDLDDQEVTSLSYAGLAQTKTIVADGADFVFVTDASNTLGRVALDTGVADWDLAVPIQILDWMTLTPF